jgi:HD-like signal output (HDOD) protein
MPKILIVDGSPICLELLAKTLEGAGFTVSCARKSSEAMGVISKTRPDLLIIDPATDCEGMRLVETLRQTPTARMPVIVLTDLVDKASVRRAGQLGIRDYMLKQRFSLAELLIRVQKNVQTPGAPPAGVAPVAVGNPPEVAKTSRGSAQETTPAKLSPSFKRLTRDQTLARVEACSQAKTLPGAVTEIIGLVNSPRGAISDLAQALKRDPVLAARVLQLANSAAFTSQKPRITSVDEAVRNIGTGGVRGMVMSVGIFESFATDGPCALDILRFWQHSFAVAAIMEKLVPASDAAPPGSAHLVGLCHDLAELALSQQFPAEYAAASELSSQTGEPFYHARSLVFGLPYHELAVALLRKLGLPPMITVPIEEVIERSAARQHVGAGSILARALRMANVYANGLMLASGPDASITPLSTAECRSVFESAAPPALDDWVLRSEALTMVNMLSGISPKEATATCRPPLEKTDARIWYARHAGYGEFDPLAACLKMAGDVEIHSKPPAAVSELEACDVIVIAGPRQSNPGSAQQQIGELLKFAATHPRPFIYLSGADSQSLSAGDWGTCRKLPIQLPELVGVMKWGLGKSKPRVRSNAA